MASVHLVTYDLNKPGQDYPGLYDAIKAQSNGAWWHHLDSTWLIATNRTPSQVKDAIKQVVDSSDSFLVVDITRDTYSGWLPKKAWDWIHQWVDGLAA